MAVYAYKAYRSRHAELLGTIAADTPRHARELLRASGLLVSELRPVRKEVRWFRLPSGSASRVLEFFRELSTLLAVGIRLVPAIDSLMRQHKGRFGEVLLRVRERVASGSSLAESLRAEPEVFDELSVSMVDVGERSGTLDEVLLRLSVFKERTKELRGRIGNAMIYPVIVLVMAGVIAVLLMTFVVPSILGPLIQTGRNLPTITRIVKGLSDLLIERWWLLGLGAALLCTAVLSVLRSDRGQAVSHRWVLRIPIIGTLIKKQTIVRLSIVLSTLLRTGVVFVKALEIARASVSNRVFQDALRQCEAAILAGRDIGAAMERTGAFPPTVVQVFSVGQESGELEKMLERLASDYDRDVQAQAQRFAAILEPLMIFLLALVVAAIAFATILPILEAGHVL